MRAAITAALGVPPGATIVTMTDFAGAAITQSVDFMVSKLLKDVDHAAFAGWLAVTLANPIEVWDRIDNGSVKRHYFSAYGFRQGKVVYHVAAVATPSGVWITSFHKWSAAGIDSKRDGTLIHRC